MEIVFRKLEEDDASAYWSLRLEGIEQQPFAFGQTSEDHRRTSIEDTVALLLHRDGFVAGAFDGDSLVGIARFVRETAEKERHKGHLYRVYVTGSHRGRGVAKALIGFVIAETARDPTFEQLLLSVGVHNAPARALYQSMGFVGFGIEPRALKVGSQYFDEEHMMLVLQDSHRPKK